MVNEQFLNVRNTDCLYTKLHLIKECINVNIVLTRRPCSPFLHTPTQSSVSLELTTRQGVAGNVGLATPGTGA